MMNTPTASTPQSPLLAGHLAHDHSRLDLLLDEVCRCVDDGEHERAEHAFAEFADDHATHVALEEEILFPLYEARAWRAARATAVMRHQHRSIEAIIDAMGSALQRGDTAGFGEARRRLGEIQPSHHLQEEQVLYAAIDGVLTETERKDVVRRLAERGRSLKQEAGSAHMLP